MPERQFLIQKRHPYTGNLNSKTLGDSNNTFLYWEHGFDAFYVIQSGL